MQNQFVDLYRNGIRTAAEVTKMSLENAVRLQEKQLGIMRDLVQESVRSAERLNGAETLQDVMSVQSELARTQMERMSELWSSMWKMAGDGMGAAVREAYSGSRTSEDVVRAAANQVARAAGSVPESAVPARRSAASR